MKAKASKDRMRLEYQSEDFPDGFVRGKYAAKAKAASNVAVIEPELVSAFPNSAAVNLALRALLRATEQVEANRSPQKAA